MAEHKNIKRSGVLSRILRDEAGNTIAIMAAAVIPIIGLVGGAVDVSRIFLVQTKMQAACDAGSLMGRKVMGGGSWSDNSYRARDRGRRNVRCQLPGWRVWRNRFEPRIYRIGRQCYRYDHGNASDDLDEGARSG